ncbi:MAG: choice-of-anchor J domain-containing protein [Muribaculaceae bacterium]|nr:choice-of-anchor J domain-containing protein [Muribaculaceae bacterium]
MRKFLQTFSKIFLGILLCFPSYSRAEVAKIYGNMIASDGWSGWDSYPGIYSVSAEQPLEPIEEYCSYNVQDANGGAFLAGGIYYMLRYEGIGDRMTASIDMFDVSSWDMTGSYYCSTDLIAKDITYDQMNQIAFLACSQNGHSELKRWNLDLSSDPEIVGDLSTELLAVSCDTKGNLYGIGVDCVLYSIDTQTASMTAIGNTGVDAAGLQSATFDPKTGILYWAALHTDNSTALYSVDIATGFATKIGDFPQNEQFVGLYILAPEADDNAPASLSDFNVSFESPSTSGSVSFRLPTLTFGGNALSGDVEYILNVDGQKYCSGKAAAGSLVTEEVVVDNGNHIFMACAYNEAGFGPSSKYEMYIGCATPGAVENLEVTVQDAPNKVKVSWEIPTYWEPYDGFQDLDNLTYSVVRKPDNVTVADHISETCVNDMIDYSGDLTPYYYEVTPHVANLSGLTERSQNVVVGYPIIPPFKTEFSSKEIQLCTIIDANSDRTKWGEDFFSSAACIGGRWDGDCDDWLIMPPVTLKAGALYRVQMNVSNGQYGASQWSFNMGELPNVDSMTTELLQTSPAYVSFDKEVKVEKDGIYYFGIHCTGGAGSDMYAISFEISDEMVSECPEAPEIISVVGAEKGELSAIMTVCAPEANLMGNRLSEITALNIYHGQDLVKTVTDIEPGEEYTITGIPANQGWNDFAVSAVNVDGEGRKAEIKDIYVGIDWPSNITEINLSEDAEGNPVISWPRAEETGLMGYYVNPDEVSYIIYRVVDGNYDVVEDDFKGTEFIDSSIDNNMKQCLLSYWVYPVTIAGEGNGIATNQVAFGKPYECPWTETFYEGSSDCYPWYFTTDNAEYTGWSMIPHSMPEVATVPNFDGSEAFMAFIGGEVKSESTLYSPLFTVKNSKNPILDLYYYNVPGWNDLDVIVGGNKILTMSYDPSYPIDWHRYKVSLSDFKNLDKIQLNIVGETDGQDWTNAFIDYIRIREELANDLNVFGLSVPEKITLGEGYKVVAKVRNDGESTSNGGSFVLYRNGYEIFSQSLPNLRPAQTLEFSFDEIPSVVLGDKVEYYAEVKYDLDENDDNNVTPISYSSMAMPRYPVPVNLTAISENGMVHLEWDAPAETMMTPDPILEDFESYETFGMSAGQWTMYDADKEVTNVIGDPESWFDNLDYPNAEEPMAFQVMDFAEAGVDLDIYTWYAPHSGKQMLISPSPAEFGVGGDDWLISPLLYPGGQQVSAYLSTLISFSDVKYEILYSSTDNSPESFIQLVAPTSAPMEWTKVEFELPSDAKYFAIRSLSQYTTTGLMIDDISFAPATLSPISLEIVGYNVYRDQMCVNKELVNDTYFYDADASNGNHDYNITCVYKVGESGPSECASIFVESGVGFISKNSSSVSASESRIHVNGAEGLLITVADTNGRVIYTGVPSDNVSISVTPGIYIVNIAGQVTKIFVK